MKRSLGLFVLASLLIGVSGVEASASSPEARFVQLINQERTSRGLKALTRRSDLDAVAERHSERMRRDGDIYHNRNLGNEIPGSYAMGGENVGVGFDVDGLHAAFMDSPGHRHNILLAGFDEVGLGVVVDPSGEVYVTEVFVDRGGSSSSTKKTSSKKTSSSSSETSTTSKKRSSQPSSKPSSKPSSEPAPAPSNSTPSPSSSQQASEPAPEPAPRGPKVDRARAVDLLLRIVGS